MAIDSGIQDGWRRCNKCQGLYYGWLRPNPCPAGGNHDATGSLPYRLNNLLAGAQAGTGRQADWRWCDRCQALHYAGPGRGPSVCPAGGAHDNAGGNYVLYTVPRYHAQAQEDWTWCSACGVLFFGTNQPQSRCPAAGGRPHTPTGSGNYSLVYGEVTHHRMVAYVTKFDADTRDKLLDCAHSGSVTHVLIGLFHLGYNKDKTRYIHLNEDALDQLDWDLQKAVDKLRATGVKVLASLGGGWVGDFGNLFEDDTAYQSFYGQLLLPVLKQYQFDGLDLDIEEPNPRSKTDKVTTNNVQRLVQDLRRDLPPGFMITSAPVASALINQLSSVSQDVNYRQLIDDFDWYILQFYNSWGSLNPAQSQVTYQFVLDAVGRSYAPKLVAGVVTNPGDLGTNASLPEQGYNDRAKLEGILASFVIRYPDFGGICGWTFQNAQSDASGNANPGRWMRLIAAAMRGFHHTMWSNIISGTSTGDPVDVPKDIAPAPLPRSGGKPGPTAPVTHNLGFLMGDVDGDGRAELLQPWDNNGQLGMTVYRYIDSQLGLSGVWGSQDLKQGQGHVAFRLADIDGDGRMELIHAWDNGGSLALIVYRYDNDMTGFRTVCTIGDVGEGSGFMDFLTADVNGDGRAELIQLWDNSREERDPLWGRAYTVSHLGLIIYRYEDHQRGFDRWAEKDMGQGPGHLGFLAADVDGDGSAEIVQPWNNSTGAGVDIGGGVSYLFGGRVGDVVHGGYSQLGLIVYRYTDDPRQCRTVWQKPKMGQGPGNVGMLAADFDGNGNAELVQLWDADGQLGINLYRYNGDDSGFHTAWTTDNMGQGSGARAFLAADVDGDGKAELLQLLDNNGSLALIIYKYLNGAEGFYTAWTNGNLGQGSGWIGLFADDVDGDGRAELTQLWDNNGYLGIAVYKFHGELGMTLRQLGKELIDIPPATGDSPKLQPTTAPEGRTRRTSMSIDLTMNNPLSPALQAVQDQNGNTSSLYLSSFEAASRGAGFVGVLGPGGTDATATLAISTYSGEGLAPNVQLHATDQGDYSATLAFQMQPPGGGGTAPYVTPLVLSPNGIQMPNLPSPAGGSVDLVVDSAGNVARQNSSARFKEDIQPLQDDFHKILLLEPRSFTYKGKSTREIGYTAEEVAEADLQNLVAYDTDGQPQGVHYKMISIYLLELVKEQQAALADVRAEIAQLKGTTH